MTNKISSVYPLYLTKWKIRAGVLRIRFAIIPRLNLNIGQLFVTGERMWFSYRIPDLDSPIQTAGYQELRGWEVGKVQNRVVMGLRDDFSGANGKKEGQVGSFRRGPSAGAI